MRRFKFTGKCSTTKGLYIHNVYALNRHEALFLIVADLVGSGMSYNSDLTIVDEDGIEYNVDVSKFNQLFV